MASASTLATTDDGDVVRGCGSWCMVVQTVLGSRRPVTEAFGRISCSSWPPRRAFSHLEIWILTSPLYLSVFVVVNGCCLWKYGVWVLRGTEHRRRRKHPSPNPDTNAGREKNKQRKTLFSKKRRNRKRKKRRTRSKKMKKKKKKEEKRKGGPQRGFGEVVPPETGRKFEIFYQKC